MTSNENLERLLEEHQALLRQVARLEAVISVERAHSQDMSSTNVGSIARREALSWEGALHVAKIALSTEPFLPV